jgi:hypothetical protein
MTDGEGTERLWSFLRDYSRITKEMAPDKRVDVLTDGLLHYAKRLRQRFGKNSDVSVQDILFSCIICLLSFTRSGPVLKGKYIVVDIPRYVPVCSPCVRTERHHGGHVRERGRS